MGLIFYCVIDKLTEVLLMKTIAEINEIRDRMQSEIITRTYGSEDDVHVYVGMGEEGVNAGARDVFNALVDELISERIQGVKVIRTILEGDAPVVKVSVNGKEDVIYTGVTVAKAKEIMHECAHK